MAAGLPENRLARLPQPGIDLLQSGDDIGEKTGQIVVSLVKRNPADAIYAVAAANHSLSNVVLPKPAGAETRVSLRPRRSPSFSCSIRRGRDTSSDRNGGI